MAYNTKKYLDEEGLKQVVRLLDEYPDNQILGTVIDEIQGELDKKADVVDIPEVPVQDVQVNGNSVLSNGIANIPIASSNNLGAVKINENYGVIINSFTGELTTYGATSEQIKSGDEVYRPLSVVKQHESTFYGLAKAAGDTTQSQSNNAVGTYTDSAKTAIQAMLDVPAKADIPEVPVQDVQIDNSSIIENGIVNIPIATSGSLGLVKIQNYSSGLAFNSSGFLSTAPAELAAIKNASSGDYPTYRPIVPTRQHYSVFYGLAKVAGHDEKDSALPVGQYTDSAKEAIQSMLGVSQMLAPTNPNLVASQAYSTGDVFAANGHLYKATAAIAQDEAIIPDTNCVETTMVDESVRDVQVAGSSIVGSGGVANIPIGNNKLGAVKIGATAYGLQILNDGEVRVIRSSDKDLKAGTSGTVSLAPNAQHKSVFYGLSKVAGVDLKDETVTLGTYPEASKTAIKEMLGVQDGLKVVRLI